MHRAFILAALLLVAVVSPSFATESGPTFKTKQLTPDFYCEGAHYGDFDRDGAIDLIAGPYIYFGPKFEDKSTIYVPKKYSPQGYSENFLTFTHDLNGDGWIDIIQVGWPGKETYWYVNPGKPRGEMPLVWERHLAFPVTDNESPGFQDVTGDGKPELLFHTEGFLGYAEPNWKEPTQPWTFHRISPQGKWQRYTHGFGVGDLNGDGRPDIMEATGWWEQPESLEGDPLWRHHPWGLFQAGAQVYAYDVDGDKDNDVISVLHAHRFGLCWFENVREGDEIKFIKHGIMGETPEDSAGGVVFTQPHAVELADVDGDGLKDIITGKRFWAHGPKGDVEPNAPAVLYWFQLQRTADGKVKYIPHQIHDDSGVGTQVVAGDLNGDGRTDVLVGNKKGAYVHLQQPPSEKEAAWTPLFDGKSLKNWKKTNFGGEGEILVEDGVLVLDVGSPLTGLTWKGPQLPTMNYELHAVARRVQGNDFFCGLTFPVGESYCSFIPGGWGGATTGISSLDGQDAARNETTKYINYKKNAWYDIRIRVEPKRLRVWLDQRPLIDVDTTDKKISTRIEVDLSKPLGISAFETVAEIKTLEWRRLSDTPE